MKVYLIIMEGKYGAIDTDDSLCHGYYIIKFSLSPYNLQSDLIIDGQVISYGKFACEGTYFFQISNNSRYYVLQKNKSMNTVFSLRKIINGNVNDICHDLYDVVPQILRYISKNDYNNLSPLHIPMKEHNIIMDEND